MGLRDPRSILELGPDAAHEEAKAAYRRLAMRHHPDRNPGDPGAADRFRQVADAWKAIASEARDARADRKPEDATPKAPPRREPHVRAPRMTRTQPSSPAAAEVRLTLEQSFHGLDVTAEGEDTCICSLCQGSGTVQAGWRTCNACEADSIVAALFQRMGMRVARCAACHGTHRLAVIRPCPACHGFGTLLTRGTVSCRVPPGVHDGQEIVAYLGNGVRTRVRVKVARSSRFCRLGDDLAVTRRLSAVRAAKGSRLTIRGVDGRKLRVLVARGAASGTTLRVPGHGMPDGHGGRGNLLVKLEIT